MNQKPVKLRDVVGELAEDVAISVFGSQFERVRELSHSLLGGLKIADPIAEAMKAITRQEIELHTWFRKSDEALRRSEATVRTLARSGWTLPMWAAWDFPIKLTAEEALNVAEIDAAFGEYYTRNGGQAFDDIAAELVAIDGLAPWRPLLSECVSAYRRGDFNVPIPALFTIIEGASIVIANAPSKKEPIRPMAAAASASKETMALLVRVSLLEFLREFFASCSFAQDEPRRPNRHWVLHGRTRRAFERLDCIRLFHALHTLAHEITSVVSAANKAAGLKRGA